MLQNVPFFKRKEKNASKHKVAVFILKQQGSTWKFLNTYFLGASRTVGALDEQVDQIEEIDEQRVIELLQLAPTVEVLRVQPLDALGLERPDDGVVGVEHVAEHGVAVVDRRRRSRGASPPHILVRVKIDILDGRQRQGADLYRFGGRHARDVGGLTAVERQLNSSSTTRPDRLGHASLPDASLVSYVGGGQCAYLPCPRGYRREVASPHVTIARSWRARRGKQHASKTKQ